MSAWTEVGAKTIVIGGNRYRWMLAYYVCSIMCEKRAAKRDNFVVAYKDDSSDLIFKKQHK